MLGFQLQHSRLCLIVEYASFNGTHDVRGGFLGFIELCLEILDLCVLLTKMLCMQRMLGRSKFEALLGNLVEKPQSKPVLVPISDKRPAIHNAKLDFEEENENDPCN